MSISPEGESLRQAVKWISAERQDHPQTPLQTLIDQACLRFNLTPSEAAYLERLMKKEGGA